MRRLHSSFALLFLFVLTDGCAPTRPVVAQEAPVQSAPQPRRPDGGRYPNLVKSWDALQSAKGHVQRAEAAHAPTGTLGGHGGQAVQAINAAEREIDEAVTFADMHHTPGPAGVAAPKPPLTAVPDDVKYPNLGDARLQIEWAIQHIEDAMQIHAPIGTLGGHGERAVEHLRRALGEITQSERWADTHR